MASCARPVVALACAYVCAARPVQGTGFVARARCGLGRVRSPFLGGACWPLAACALARLPEVGPVTALLLHARPLVRACADGAWACARPVVGRVCIVAMCPPASSGSRMVCAPRCTRCMCRPGNSLVRCRPPFAAGVGLWCPSPGRDPHAALRSGGDGGALAFWHWACCPLIGVAICNTLSPWPAFPGRPRCP